MTPELYLLTARALQDESPGVRAGVRDKLLRCLQQPRRCALSPRWAAAAALAAADPDPAAAEAAGRVFCVCCAQLRRAGAADVQRCVELGWRGGDTQTVVTRQPEYLLTYLIWLLAHDPGAPLTAQQARDKAAEGAYERFHATLQFAISALLGLSHRELASAQPQGQALPLILRVCRTVKLAEDVSDARRNFPLYSLCDLASAVAVRAARRHKWDSTVEFPGKVPLHGRYFKARSRGESRKLLRTRKTGLGSQREGHRVTFVLVFLV